MSDLPCTPSSELKRISTKLGIACREVPPGEGRAFKDHLAGHLGIRSADALWADGVIEWGIKTLEPWVWIARLRGDGPFRVFFWQDRHNAVLQFDVLQDLARSLEQVAPFHFALTRPSFDFVLVNDYEGGIRGHGVIQEWHVEEKQETFTLPPLPEKFRGGRAWW